MVFCTDADAVVRPSLWSGKRLGNHTPGGRASFCSYSRVDSTPVADFPKFGDSGGISGSGVNKRKPNTCRGP